MKILIERHFPGNHNSLPSLELTGGKEAALPLPSIGLMPIESTLHCWTFFKEINQHSNVHARCQ
jgi:hypothetical protein